MLAVIHLPGGLPVMTWCAMRHAGASACLVEVACLDAARCLCGIINDPALSLRKEVERARVHGYM